MQKLASIKVTEVGSDVVVSGKYGEMKDVYPELKKMKFRYNPYDRTWYIPKSKMTVSQVETIVDGLTKQVPVIKQNKSEDNRELLEKIRQDCLTLKYIKVSMVDGYKLSIRGLPYGFFDNKTYRDGSAEYENGVYYFKNYVAELTDILKKYDGKIIDALSAVRSYDGTTIGVKPFYITLSIDDAKLKLNYSDSRLEKYIERAFPQAKESINIYSVLVTEIGDIKRAVDVLRSGCDALGAEYLQKKIDEEEKKKSGYYTISYNTAWSTKDINDFNVGEIVKNEWNSSPEWLKIISVRKTTKYEGHDYFFEVKYAPLTDDELASWLIDLNKERGNASAKKRIREIFDHVQKKWRCSSKTCPAGKQVDNR